MSSCAEYLSYSMSSCAEYLSFSMSNCAEYLSYSMSNCAEYLSYSMSNCDDCLTCRNYPPPSNSTVIEPEGSIPATLKLLTGDYHELLKILFKIKTSEIRIITVLWHVLLQIGHTAQCLTMLCVLLTVLAVMRRSVGLLVVASMMLRNADNVFAIC